MRSLRKFRVNVYRRTPPNSGIYAQPICSLLPIIVMVCVRYVCILAKRYQKYSHAGPSTYKKSIFPSHSIRESDAESVERFTSTASDGCSTIYMVGFEFRFQSGRHV